MLCFSSASGYTNVLPGIRMKTLAFGKKTLLVEFRMAKGSELPPHTHIHEQTGYLVKGRIRLKVGKTSKIMRQGDCWCIPGNLIHGAKILSDAIAVEVFSPVRKEYLPKSESRKSE
jgi:quercetin dioxygenase-like cupin family protein